MPAQRGQKKGKKGKKDEPKKKQYIPPVKPARAVIDPVDLYGLGVAGDSAVGADVVVSLRKLAKKDEKTIARALDELQQWIETMRIGGGNIAEAMSALPVWVRLIIILLGRMIDLQFRSTTFQASHDMHQELFVHPQQHFTPQC